MRLVIAITLVCLALAPATADTFKQGDVVAANVEEDKWYIAKLGERDGSKFAVTYGDDDAQTTLSPERMRPIIAAKGKLAVGDRVVAVWNGGPRMYAGAVSKVTATSFVVTWDDGSKPSTVEPGKLARLEPAIATKFELGATVGAKYGGDWWIAIVTGIKDGGYAVTYSDGTKGKVRAGDVRATARAKDLTTGTRVLAMWLKDRKLYSGVIKSKKGDSFTVAWDDDTTPSAVLAKHIIKIDGAE